MASCGWRKRLHRRPLCLGCVRAGHPLVALLSGLDVPGRHSAHLARERVGVVPRVLRSGAVGLREPIRHELPD